MSELTLAALRQQLEADIRSGGHDGLTTAADVRRFLGSLLTELDALDTTQAAQALAGRHIAEAITQDYVRTAYPDAQAAINGAGDHGTATVYSLAYGDANPNDPNKTVPGLAFPNNNLITNLQGLALYTPDANTDVLTFSGGTQVVNAHHTTIVTHPVLHNPGQGQGWTVTAPQGLPLEVTIHDLNLIIQGQRTNGLYFRNNGHFQFSGDITMQRVPALAMVGNNGRQAVHNWRGTLLGKGSLTAYGHEPTPEAVGAQHRLFVVGPAATVTWEGSIRVYDDVAIELSANASLVLREGLLDARERTAGAPLFSNALGTVVLENYALLGRPEEEAIRADTVILRGSSVVVGTLTATHIIDERPAGSTGNATTSSGASVMGVVHLDGAETITGLKTFTGDVLIGNGQDGSGLKIRKPSGEGYLRLLDVTNVDRPNSINFGAVGEGGDLRYHGTTHRWLANGGGPATMLLDEQANLAVAGQVRATAFVGDGAQLTSVPTGPRCTATGLAQTQFTGSPSEFVLPFNSATGTGYDTTTHRFTPGKAGFYGITMGALVSNTSVGGELYVGLKINGGRYVMVQHWPSAVTGPKGGGTGYVEVELAATDSVEALLLHDNGNQPYQVFDEYFRTFFSARWLGN